ncbi:MAG: glycosyltransferase family 2 protein [Magnetococcus sp. DMHC-1]|nr:glycosyltransferase family 2 protein [Magnetococcales bacterium]
MKNAKSLTIVVPCYNEAKTLVSLVGRVLTAETLGLQREIIIVDDGSRDNSRELAQDLARQHPDTIRLVVQPVNQGKGAALRAGFQAATGDLVLVQDADLEYDPCEYPRLLKPILDGVADVVYGSRFRGGDAGRVLYFWHSVGNRFLTLLSNIFTNLNLTDMETCFKVFRREVLAAIQIEENRFGFEPEITAKVARLGSAIRIYEVGISYHGRSYADGKKITWRDGFWAIYCILRYNLSR